MATQKDDDTGGTGSLLDRRTLLALAGSATIAGIVGAGSAAASTSLPEALVLDATGRSEPCEYAVEVTDELSVVPTAENTVTSADSTTVQGTVSDGYCGIEYAGEVAGLTIDGGADVLFGDDAAAAMPDPSHELTITAPDEVSYEFTTTGRASKVLDGSDVAAEDGNDSVVQNDDGTCTVSGYTGNGYGDSYVYEGSVESFSADGEYGLVVDGEETTASALTGQDADSGGSDDLAHRLAVRSTDGSLQQYAVTVDGTARTGSNTDTHEHAYQDRVVDNGDGTVTIEGWVRDRIDDYPFEGTVTAVEAADPIAFAVDGTAVSRDELVGGADGGDATGPAIGGGDGYASTVSPDDATTTVSTRSGLSSALSGASAGDVVYVAGDADIDMGTATVTVPAGVTLASDRGIDGAPGGRIYTTGLHGDHYGMIRAARNARVTGLRVEGPIDPQGWTPHSYDYEITGIYATDVGVEVDNVEVHGWGYACVYTHDDTHVHHSTIHHANVEGLGYGVMANSAENPIVEYNYFYHNRHGVATSGGGGYTARYNRIDGHAISHVFDQHSPGGTTTKIYNNTVTVVDNANKDKKVPGVAIRGVPDDTADVYNNWFHNPEEPRDAPNGWTDEAIIQVHTDAWRNVSFWNNHYGSDEPASDVGCPR